MKKIVLTYAGILFGLALTAFAFRANLDFLMTKDLTLSVNFGTRFEERRGPNSNESRDGTYSQAFYEMNHTPGWLFPVSYTVAAVNCLLFALGAFALGKKFALSIIVGTFAYPLFMNIFERMDTLADLTDDKLLAALFGGVLAGLGLGIVIKCGASTGGTDVIAIVLNRKMGIPVGPPMYLVDFSILISQVFFAEGAEEVLLGIMLTFLLWPTKR